MSQMREGEERCGLCLPKVQHSAGHAITTSPRVSGPVGTRAEVKVTAGVHTAAQYSFWRQGAFQTTSSGNIIDFKIHLRSCWTAAFRI